MSFRWQSVIAFITFRMDISTACDIVDKVFIGEHEGEQWLSTSLTRGGTKSRPTGLRDPEFLGMRGEAVCSASKFGCTSLSWMFSDLSNFFFTALRLEVLCMSS